MPKYLSGRVKRTAQSELSDDRYQYLGLEQTEPNLGDPPTGAGTPGIPVGVQYQVVSVLSNPGERYWTPIQGGLIPGAISIYDEGTLVGSPSSITQLNFVGAGVTADGVALGIAATVTVRPPGPDNSVLFKDNNDFATSSNLVFDTNVGVLTASRLNIGIGGTLLTSNVTGYIGISSTIPTQSLTVGGNIKLDGTIYDFNNDPGSQSNILTKGANGIEWTAAGAVTAGAGGTIYDVQFHNTAGLVDGASNFVFRDDTDRVGIGSTQPTTLLDVLGISSFNGGVTADRVYITGVSTALNLINADGGIKANTAQVTDLTTGRVVTVGTSGELQDNSSLTFNNTTSTLGTLSLAVTENTTTAQLKVTGITTIGNVKISANTVTTSSGALNLNAAGGTVESVGAFYISNTTPSTSKDTGALVVEGGVGIEENFYVGGAVSFTGPSGYASTAVTLAYAGGITTTGGDLYVGRDLYINRDLILDDLTLNTLTVNSTSTFKGDVQFHGANGITSAFWDKSDNRLKFNDESYASFGTGNDLQIYHTNTLRDQTDSNGDSIVDGRTSLIKETGSGGLIFKSNGGDGPGAYQFFDQGWRNLLKLHGGTNARAILYAQGTSRFETTGVGATVIGNFASDSFNVAGIATFYGPLHDKNMDPGSSGFVLSSTVTGTDWIDPNGLAVDTAEKVKITAKSDNNTYHLTFVDDTSTAYQGICVDNDTLTWNASTNLLTAQKLKVESIEEWGSVDTGGNEQVITADGSGGWTWKDNVSGGIGTVFVKQYQDSSGSSRAPFKPDMVDRTCLSFITVDQTTTGIATIGIAETSNAYGNKFTQDDDPTSVAGGSWTVCDGDIWYDDSAGGGSAAGGIVIQDEGSSLSTIATTLDFVGSGVVASGTGATKTITISGGSGSSTLSGLTDTTIASPVKNQTLIYDGSTSKWRNISQSVANVKDYGAAGDNATDDTAAIQAAIDSLSGATYDGGTVYFPAGIYRISSALSIDSADNSITLKGCSTHFPLGGDGSLIRSTSTTANGIEITNSLSIAIQNLRIDTSVTKTDGIAIDCESSTDIQGITIDQVYINGFCKGINITGYSVSAVRNTEIRAQPNSANSTYGILVDKGSDTRVDQIRFQNIIIDAVHSGSSKHDYSSGFLFKNYVNSIWMYDCAVLRSKIGIDFDSTLSAGTATTGAFFRLQNCDVDQNKEDGIYINGGTQIWIENQYMSSNGQNGLETGSSFGGTLWITNGDCRGNGYHGINLGANHKKVHITNPHCAVNSTASSDTYHGINVASGGEDIQIIGGQCGGDVYGTTTGATTNGSISQSYGIMFLGSNHKRIQIMGVDCTDNNSGAMGWQTSGDDVTAGSYNWIQFVAGYSTGQTTFP